MPETKIDPLKLRQMVEANKPYAEIAEYFHMTVGGVQQAVERLGLTKQRYLRHDKAIPWKLAREHSQSGPANSLRRLSRIAQGQEIPLTKKHTALRWANRLIEANKDIDYSKEKGFFEKDADPDNWHVRQVLADAEQALEQ
ncbi:hypothetical protein GCM10022252_20210 [Streptosporangium oxazolinicum]|uniref:Uncharacterized protein n=1 Tax=Streptosporangium oxazolinicum TaxID=909287 RepID=A0ABP8AP34_9ACTN